MSSESVSREQIFNRAAEIKNLAEQKKLLDQICGSDLQLRADIEDLLSQDRKLGDFLEPPANKQAASRGTVSFDPDDTVTIGTSIGNYELKELIGQGGMGDVYLAQQQHPVKRRVALKLVRCGMESRHMMARFNAEGQALAMMEHPHIARFYDAGTTSKAWGDIPYFVMEYVAGESVTKFCDTENLSILQRIKLFQRICRAVQHAHQKGIIHRDLKPSNIIVSKVDDLPVPKIIDFGLAKATGSQLTELTLHTRFGQVMGTLQYMSPEQTHSNGLDVDTRSDVYALGAILYELLVGSPPFDADSFKSRALDQIVRMIREDDPPALCQRLTRSSSDSGEIAGYRRVEPAKLKRIIEGDLEWIVMKALEKNPSKRYSTPMELADDLQQFVEHKPVTAGQPSFAYQAQKFVRRNLRHHPLRSGLVAACLMMMVFGIAALYFVQQLHVRDMLRNGEAYLARMAEARELLSKRDTPWRERAMGLLEEAAELELPDRNDVHLRTLAATTAVQRDLRPLATIAMGIWCDVLAFDPQGKFLAVGQNKDTTGFSVWIYQVSDLQAKPYHLWIDDAERTAVRKRKNQPKPEDGARAMCFSPDGRRLAVGTRHGRLHLFDWDGQKATHVASHDPDPGVEVFRINYSADGQLLWVLSDGEKLRVLRDGVMREFAPIGDAIVTDMAVSTTENAIFLIRNRRSVQRYDFESVEPVWQQNLQNIEVANLAVSSDGRYLFLPLEDGPRLRFQIVESAYGHERSSSPLEDKLSGIYGVFGWDNSFVVTTSYQRIVTFWDVARRKIFASHVVAQRGGKPRIATSPTEPLMAVAEHQKVTLFRIDGTEITRTFAHNSGAIADIAVAANGRRIATVGRQTDGVLDKNFLSYCVWDVDAWHPVMSHYQLETTTMRYPEEPRLTFTPDGQSLVSVDSRSSASVIPTSSIPSRLLTRWTARKSSWVPADAIEFGGTSKRTTINDSEARKGQALSILPLDGRRISLTISDFPSSFYTDDNVHVYVLCRVGGEAAERHVQLKVSSGYIRSVTEIGAADDQYSAIWCGQHPARQGFAWTIEMEFAAPVNQLILDGVLFTRDRLCEQICRPADEILDSNDSSLDRPNLGAMAIHGTSKTIWNVVDKERLRIVSAAELEPLDSWTNRSTSSVSGLGSLEPVLATDQWVIAGTIGGEIFVFDGESRQLENSAVVAESEVRGLCFLPESQRLVAAFNDGAFRILELPGMEVLQTVEHHRLSVESICYDARRRCLFAGSEDGTISVWRLENGEFMPYFSIDLMLGSISRLAYLDRGDRLVALIAGATALREIRLGLLYDRLRDIGINCLEE